MDLLNGLCSGCRNQHASSPPDDVFILWANGFGRRGILFKTVCWATGCYLYPELNPFNKDNKKLDKRMTRGVAQPTHSNGLATYRLTTCELHSTNTSGSCHCPSISKSINAFFASSQISTTLQSQDNDFQRLAQAWTHRIPPAGLNPNSAPALERGG